MPVISTETPFAESRGFFTTPSVPIRYLLALTLGILPICKVYACDRNLTGTWKSDKGVSMTFIRESSKLLPKTETFLESLLGNMTLTFTETDLLLVMPDINVSVAGELRPFAGFQERKPFKVLFCSTDMIVFSARHPFSQKDVATTFNFEGPDIVWVYLGSTIPGAPNLHIREYFQRVH